jgi:hypothetical protein
LHPATRRALIPRNEEDAVKNQPTPGEWVIMAAGAVMLIFAFLPFYTNGDSVSTFGEGLFPVATIIPLYGVIAAVQVAITRFGNVQFPPRIGGYTWPHIHVLLGLFATLLALAFLVLDKGNADFGVGFFFELLGAIALLVGGILLLREPRREATA